MQGRNRWFESFDFQCPSLTSRLYLSETGLYVPGPGSLSASRLLSRLLKISVTDCSRRVGDKLSLCCEHDVTKIDDNFSLCSEFLEELNPTCG